MDGGRMSDWVYGVVEGWDEWINKFSESTFMGTNIHPCCFLLQSNQIGVIQVHFHPKTFIEKKAEFTRYVAILPSSNNLS